MKNDIEDLKAVFDELFIQETMNTVKLNMLTDMVLGLYSETLPEETWKNIHRNFFTRLREEMNDAFNRIDQETFNPVSIRKKLDFDFLMSKKLDALDSLHLVL